jgi:hypothetical protein
MSKKLIAKVGTYQKNGETKNEYDELGVMLENDKGPYILLDPSINLAGVLIKQNITAVSEGKQARSNVMISVFDSENNQQQSNQQNQGYNQQPQQQPQQQNNGYQNQQNPAY